MTLETIKKYAGWITAFLLLCLFFTGIGCFHLYMNNLGLSTKLNLTKQVAVKDSIKAKESDITVKNLVHPEEVIKDTVNGFTYLKIKTTSLSTNELPSLLPTEIPDDSNQLFRTQTAEKNTRYDNIITTLNDSIHHLNKSIDALNILTDSLVDKVFAYTDRYFSVAQIKSTRTGKIDSVQRHYTAVLYPMIQTNRHHYAGIAQWDTVPPKHTKNYSQLSLISPDTTFEFIPHKKRYDLYLYNPVFAIALQATTNYNPSVHSWQVGPGVRVFYKGFNMYVPYYYNITDHKFNNTITFSLSKTLAKWEYSPKR